MIWTQEMRDKSIATRLAKRQKKESEINPSLPSGNGNNGVTSKDHSILAHAYGDPLIHPVAGGFDWNAAPLPEAMTKLADMKREYDRAAAIVMRRQTVPRPTWTCWSQLHKELVPKSVMSICRRGGDDGKWAFRDDGVFEIRDGLRIPNPAFCCNSFCYAVYQKSQPLAALSRR